ncbi:MAG: ribonuclease M5 [Bacilli bacterium]|nr:ribonuclease M5 [Acholeplasmataceae bacterium]MDY2902372.1 ribonuclease M5 [Bacilli bacterium]
MVIVVEGKNDVNKLKNIYPECEFIITNGSAVSKETLELIRICSINNEVIICVDPDGPGEKIRRIICSYVPNVNHVFAKKADAISKNRKKIGIEHMHRDSIKEMFSNVKMVKQSKSNITYADLYKIGLMDSKEKRNKICEKLHISYCNGKQFLKRINMFGISLEELKKYDM